MEGITDCRYRLFALSSIDQLASLIDHEPGLCGLNVTTPYKQAVIPYVEPDAEAAEIGAVNTVRIRRQTGSIRLEAFNTDRSAFTQAYHDLTAGKRALILGTGGAALAVRKALSSQKPATQATLVSRNPRLADTVSYARLHEKSFFKDFNLIVNATPAGMYPNIAGRPDIPYEWLSADYTLIDLVYNPAETAFLYEGIKMGAVVRNGLEMLHLQAEASWKIWNVL